MPRKLAFIGVLLWLVSCGGAPTTPAPPPVATPTGHTPDPAPELRPATTYGGNHDIILLSDESVIWEQVIDAFGKNLCTIDASLTTAARMHAEDLAAHPKLDPETGIDFLRFALRMAGSADYAVMPIVFSPDNQGILDLLEIISERNFDWTHCGVGVTNEGTTTKAVWIATRRNLHVNPFPANLDAGTIMTIKGTIATRATSEVAAYLERPNGMVSKVNTFIIGNRFSVDVPMQNEGRHILELQVTGDSGPETEVLVPIYVGVPIKERPVVLPTYDEADLSPKKALTNLINSVRKRAGLHPLARDSRLDRVAQSHCQDMVATGYFGHFSPSSGLLGDRLKRNELYPASTAENVARSTSIMRVHHNLMQSPSHKIKLLTPEFTHMGLGVAKDGESVVVTQVFAAW